MNVKTMDKNKIAEAMRKAVATYIGPVTRCPLGKARAKPTEKMDKAAKWLGRHYNDQPSVDAKEQRRRQRKARAQRERIAKRNAAVRKAYWRAGMN